MRGDGVGVWKSWQGAACVCEREAKNNEELETRATELKKIFYKIRFSKEIVINLQLLSPSSVLEVVSESSPAMVRHP